jgi:hypothetical protein
VSVVYAWLQSSYQTAWILIEVGGNTSRRDNTASRVPRNVHSDCKTVIEKALAGERHRGCVYYRCSIQLKPIKTHRTNQRHVGKKGATIYCTLSYRCFCLPRHFQQAKSDHIVTSENEALCLKASRETAWKNSQAKQPDNIVRKGMRSNIL